MNCSIFLTGSNSKLLSGELATHLSGIYMNFKIMSFSSRSYCLLTTGGAPIEVIKKYIESQGEKQ